MASADGAERASVEFAIVDAAGPNRIVRLFSPAVSDADANALERLLLAVADRSGGRIVVSLSGAHEVGSAGINALIRASRACEALGGGLVLCEVPPGLRKMLRVTRLDRVISCVSTVAEGAALLERHARRGRAERAA
jgi:anti-anti-sigma factor